MKHFQIKYNPLRTIFLVISAASESNPITNTDAFAYFVTDSIPMTPIYLENLSVTSFSITFIYFI